MRLLLGYSSVLFLVLLCSPSWSKKFEVKGVITVSDGRGENASPMDVYFYRPRSFQANGRVLIVIHGQSRNADRYRDYFIDSAERYGVLVLAPEFSREIYRGSRQFNLGNMKNRAGQFLPIDARSYLVIDRVFEQAKSQLGFMQKGYSLFGHSAGSQFVHRMILFCPSKKLIAAVAANAGWYTVPDIKVEFPYGMGNTIEADKLLSWSFKQKLIILLGQDDDNENHRSLRTTQKAKAQGPHRLARGLYFYRTAKEMAQRLATPFFWKISVVPGVGHSGWRMADPAADLLFGGSD